MTIANRRLLLVSGLALAGCAAARGNAESPREGAEAEVTPAEDLMQEHGLIERVLLLYDEAAGRIERGGEVDPAVLARAADLVRRFVGDYHERNEEQYVFPRLEAAKVEVALVELLRRQHQRGREVTAEVLRLTARGRAPAELAPALRGFSRMYRPHAAREDTVLFPAFRAIIGRGAYRELGERFEGEEHARFGEHGFEATVAEVARLEQAMAIDDLAAFTAPPAAIPG